MKDKLSREIICIGCHKKFSEDLLENRCRVTIKGSMYDFIPETWDICPECRRRKKRSVYSKFKSKQYLHDWARKIKSQFPTIGNVVTESRLRELGVELLIEAEADKSLLTPVPKHKIRELVESKAHKFLMDNFVNEIPPIEKMPLDETARWIQYIEKLIYSSLEAYVNLREGKEE